MLARTTVEPLVTIGGVPAQVTFSGLAPGFAGLYQVTVRMPEGVAAGERVPLVVRLGAAVSNTVFIAVR